jgi:predicted metal-binding membrane protein
LNTIKLSSAPKILILIVVITLSAWGFLFYQHWQMTTQPMSEMWMPPESVWQWKMSDFIVVYIMWAVMMAAMMLPSTIPMIKTFSKTCRQRYDSDMPYSTIFSLAYLMVWFAFSIVLTLLQWQLHGLQWLSKMMDSSNTQFAAVIFIVAGVYQFTAIKNACLQHCRSPFSFLLNYWQNGKLGAFNMGIVHGSTCLGCCWVQMMLMFAVGVMNITGMILITLFILLEKSLPENNNFISRSAGIMLCLWGTGMLFFQAV